MLLSPWGKGVPRVTVTKLALHRGCNAVVGGLRDFRTKRDISSTVLVHFMRYVGRTLRFFLQSKNIVDYLVLVKN